MTDQKKIYAVLVDDSEQARKLLRLMLLELASDIVVAGEAADVNSAVDLIRKLKPDVVFLDIEMPGKSGLQLLDELPRDEVHYEIIFTTAFNDYALKAFRLSAIDYLLKPIPEKDLVEALERLRDRKDQKELKSRLDALTSNLNAEKEKVLCIPVMSGYEYLKLNEIDHIEADGSYTKIMCVDGKTKTVSKNLKYFENALLDQDRFIRVHRSFLINLDQMKAFSRTGRGTIVMKSGKEIDLARDRREDFFAVAGIL
ncbi:MAG: response regulator transcription factor [Crocinitomicaceae bacterium]|nr:response regulator transcription factor [Crocinitomicaceae bacterium]